MKKIAQVQASGDDTSDLESQLSDEQKKLDTNIATDKASAGATSKGVVDSSNSSNSATASDSATTTTSTSATASAADATAADVAQDDAVAVDNTTVSQTADNFKELA